VNRLFYPVACLLGALALSGCAAGKSGSLANRFVKPGKPAMDYGAPAPPKESLSDYMAKIRHLSSRPARVSTLGATVEGADKRLAAALLAESVLQDAESHLRVAQEYRRLRLLDSAYARLNRALQKDSRLAEAHEEMARIWRDWRMPDQGLGYAYRAVYNDPRSASARNTLGTILDALGRPEEARRSYEMATLLEPTAAWAFNNLCYSEFRSGHLAQARVRCDEALQLAPKMAAAHNNLALTYAASGELDRARAEFLAAGDLASAQYNLGIVHLAERDYEAAAAAFEQAIQARDTFTAAKERAHEARVHVITGID
jgi:tetratricopeptide (TPR) repeat protein